MHLPRGREKRQVLEPFLVLQGSPPLPSSVWPVGTLGDMTPTTIKNVIFPVKFTERVNFAVGVPAEGMKPGTPMQGAQGGRPSREVRVLGE